MIQLKLSTRWVIGASCLTAGCMSGPATIAPEGMAPTQLIAIREWFEPFEVDTYRRYEIRPWRYRTETGAAAGRAAVHIAPPDSLRFDYQGPFRRSGRAAVVGDSALWVVPEDDFSGLVAFAPLFWAALGLPKPPPPDAPVYSLSRPNFRAWRYIVGGDTVNFVLRGNPATHLSGEIRRQGRAIGVVESEIDPATGLATEARIDLPLDASRFEFTITNVETLASIDPEIWENR